MMMTLAVISPSWNSNINEDGNVINDSDDEAEFEKN